MITLLLVFLFLVFLADPMAIIGMIIAFFSALVVLALFLAPFVWALWVMR